MNKSYIKPIFKVYPDVKIPEPKVSKMAIFIVKVLGRAYLFLLFGFTKIFLRGDKILVDSFKRALSNESRCLIAFRHPDGREPQLLSWFFLFRLKSIAAKNKVKFPRRPYAVFIYGYEVVRWGGSLVRYILPNLGAIPIHHTKLDSKGMARIYKTIIDGPHPAALAPEGQVSYSTDTIPRLETGAVRIGIQAAVKLSEQNSDSNIPLEILPLSIHFRYGASGKRAMKKLLLKIEKACGFFLRQTCKLTLHDRLKQCRDYILKLNENRYNIKSDENIPFEQRLDAVVNTALEKAERMLGIKPEGDFFPRLYRVRHLCWDRIFLPNLEKIKDITDLDRGIKNIAAGEAWHIARHQELADFAWYFRHEVPTEKTPTHNIVEYVQNLWDFANRTMGGALSQRINIPSSKIIIQTAKPINISNYLDKYKNNKKDTIDELNLELEKAYVDCINDVNSHLSI